MILDTIIKYWLAWAMGIIAGWIAYLWKQNQKTKKTQQAIQDGVKALLSDRILQMHSICKSKGFCSVQDRVSLESLHTAYHDGLHGNGTITDAYNKTKDLPYEKERRIDQ